MEKEERKKEEGVEAIIQLGCLWNSCIHDLWISSPVSAPEIILK